MQRFACPADQIDAVLSSRRMRRGLHPRRPAWADRSAPFARRGTRTSTARRRQFAASRAPRPAQRRAPRIGALSRRRSCLDATARSLAPTDGPVGYSGFAASHHGVIPLGYFNGFRPGPCIVNGRIARAVEVGMQSAYVECAANDKAGDEVVLLGDVITEAEIALAWESSPQEVLVRLCAVGNREYIGE